MLTGPDLGAAIERARVLKGVTKKAIADHFAVSPPSVQDWVKRGTIDKDKLVDLWAYFADVVGPDHWGLPWNFSVAHSRIHEPSLAHLLHGLATVLTQLTDTRLVMARAALHDLLEHPEKLDGTARLIELLLADEAAAGALPGKRQARA